MVTPDIDYVVDEQVNDISNVFYPFEVYHDDEDYMRRCHYSRLSDRDSMPGRVFKKVSRMYFKALDYVQRYGDVVEVNRRELFRLTYEVYRRLSRSMAKNIYPNIVPIATAAIYLLSRGFYTIYDMDFKVMVALRDLIQWAKERYMEVVVSSASHGDPRLYYVLSATISWIRSKANGVTVTIPSLMSAAAKIASLVMPQYTYTGILMRMRPEKGYNNTFRRLFDKLGIKIVTKPPYSVVERLEMPKSLCDILKKVVELPSYTVCV